MPQHLGIANTSVQLILRSTSGVIAPSRPIRSDGRHCNLSGCKAMNIGSQRR